MNRPVFVFVFLSAILLPSCDWMNEPHGSAVGSVEYTLSGGFAGGIHTELSIDPSGHATLRSNYPPLEDNLTPQERNALFSDCGDIRRQPDTVFGGCIDDFLHVIRWTDDRGSKMVVISGCALSPPNGGNPFPVIDRIVRLLNDVALRIRAEKSPSNGIAAIFSLDKSSYGLDEPIRFSYKVRNTTPGDRTLFFRHSSRFWFSVSASSDPGFYYTYPDIATDSSSPTTLSLGPGEEKEIAYLWDHSYRQPNGQSGLLVAGTYHVRMGMPAGDLAVQDINFDVFDRRVPLKGDVIPDWTGSDGASPRYKFQLQVTNWTTSAVTLHFANTQRIAVELWDLNFHPPTTVIYRTPISSTSDPQSVTIAPQQSMVFSETVVKGDIAPSYFWTLAKIRLLCTDFEFAREGELQIFRQL